MGTLVSISGAMIVTLYKGPPISRTLHVPSTEKNSPSKPFFLSTMSKTTSNNWTIGGLFLVISSLSYAISNTAQVFNSLQYNLSFFELSFFFFYHSKTLVQSWNLFFFALHFLKAAILKEYPSQITMVSFFCFFGAIQCAALSLFAERDPNAWMLKPDIELISILYSVNKRIWKIYLFIYLLVCLLNCIVLQAICGCVGMFTAISWCIKMKGPVFVSMFTPLEIAIASLLATIFLGETLHVGR